MKKLTILAIDQSFTSSGIVIFRNGLMVHCEKHITDPADYIFERAWDVTMRVEKLAKDHNVDVIAMEGLAYAGVGNATRDLAGLQFVIITHMRFRHQFPIALYAPGTIKKLATGKGNSKKELLIEALPAPIRAEFDALGVKKTTGLSDLTDAYWIAKTTEANYIHQPTEKK
jgi:Holliday junction resolvasome RuvABC endonuclease subunit